MNTVHYSFFEKVRTAMEQSPDHSLFADETRDYSTKEFYFASVEAANALAALGVKQGDLVFLRSTRSIDTFILFAALAYLGAKSALSDPHQGALESAEINGLKEQTAYALTNEAAGDDISAAGNWELWNLRTMRKSAFPISLGKQAVEPSFDSKTDIHAPFLIIFTSGSSNKAKAVALSQFGFNTHIENHLAIASGTPEDCLLMLLPIHHVFGVTLLAMGLWAHYRVYFAPSMDLAVALNAIQKEKVTAVDCVPSYIAAIGKAKLANGIDLPTLRLSMLGGTNLLEEDVRFIEQSLGVRVLPVYGMSECIAIAGASFDDSEETRCHSVGRPLPLCDVRLIDKSGREVAQGEEGEIIVKSPTMFLGYYLNAEATKEAVDENGFLHTGDLGRFDAENRLHIVGRKKEMIIRNGINLSPVAIEEKLLKTACFDEVAVLGVKDKEAGEVPILIATLAQQAEALGFAQVETLVWKALLKIERPKAIYIVASLPHLSSGKVDKMTLFRLFGR